MSESMAVPNAPTPVEKRGKRSAINSKVMRSAWFAYRPDVPMDVAAAQFHEWLASEKADAWDLGADVQARRDGQLPDLVMNPYRSRP